jgi:hypothetical protein
MITEHPLVRSGKSKRKPFNSNVADYLLIIATFAFSYHLTVHPAFSLALDPAERYQVLPLSAPDWRPPKRVPGRR